MKIKQILLLFIFKVLLISVLTSCGLNGSNQHVHEFGEWVTLRESTCVKEGEVVRYCSCGEKQVENIALGQHTAVVVKGYAASCTNAGLTDGERCSVCDKVIKEQTIIELKEHTEVIDKAITPTCTQNGLTEGKHCSVCNLVLTAQTVLPIAAHTYDDNNDLSCNICGCERDCMHEVRESVKGYAATCTAPGLTDGTKCSICGEILEAQTEISASGHSYTAVITASTCIRKGYTTYICSCGDSYVSDYTDNASCSYADGVCEVCGELEPTASEYFKFTLLDDGTYKVQARDKDNMPANVVIPSTYNGIAVTQIYDFRSCESLKSITIPESITYISDFAFTSYSSDYWFCIENISVDEDNEYYKTIDGNLYTKDGTTLMKYVYNSNYETEFTVPDGVTRIGWGAFAYYYSELTSITIPNSVIEIDGYAFDGCIFLNNVFFEEDSNLESIGEAAFKYCYGIKNINLPETVRFIGGGAFYCCKNLTSIAIPEGVTDIWPDTFRKCENLTSIVIPDSVNDIYGEAFDVCYSLTKVYYTGSEEEWTAIYIENTNGGNSELINATIHYNYVP